MKNLRAKQIILVLALSITIPSLLCSGQSVKSGEDVRRLLMENQIIGDDALTVLFSTGDERIQDLVRALNDPSEVVRRNAQAVIRYLGNDAGMKALVESYAKSPAYTLAGPVPLPLRDWDYEYIRKYYLSPSKEWDSRASSYIYALVLDGSPKAVTLLQELRTKAEAGTITYHYALARVKAVSQKQNLPHETDLAKVVADNAFFVSADSREHISVKLLGFNQAKDKSLLKVYVGGPPLAAEQYHVVLQKNQAGWRIFSVTPISVS